MTIQKPNTGADAAKPKKQSLLGLLFKPQIGPTISPLRESTRIFVQLVAMVFSIYGLFPKNHPALRDPNARLSFSDVIRTGFSHVEFTREGAPRTIIFFALTGMMALTTFILVITILSLFVGHAHAQTSVFVSPASNDIAQAWMNYLFLKGSTLPANFGNAALNNQTMPQALMTALAVYSNAILVVAALILFYHLASMVVETAHHGQVMGKRANQVWAPIRLVVAVGLLVPINSQLNSGQYIVIKMAELGSGLASTVWNGFLNATQATPSPLTPASPVIVQAAADLLMDEACVYDYNKRLECEKGMSFNPSAAIPQFPSTGVATTVGGQAGQKYSFSSGDVAGQDICGWYFLPDTPIGTVSPAVAAAYGAQNAALNRGLAALQPIAQADILKVMDIGDDCSDTSSSANASLTSDSLNAAIAYQTTLANQMANITKTVQADVKTAFTNMQNYGWVFAGTFLNAIERMQAEVSNAATAGVPQTAAPNPNANPDRTWAHWFFTLGGLFDDSSSTEWDVRKQVVGDMNRFSVLTTKEWDQKTASSANTACATMMGLQNSTNATGASLGIADRIFGMIDTLATWNGVWSASTATPCSGVSSGAGLNTFQVGIDLSSASDPFAQLAFLGHANLDVASDLAAIAVLLYGGAAGGAMLGAAGGVVTTAATGGTGWWAGLAMIGIGGLAGAAFQGAAPILLFFATVFFICGFTLAYVLPMFPFTRFFFAVLGWIGAILEAIIAIPLVALAHLNPEGEGIAGGAKSAYYFVFNIFLRPVLMIFGLICGLLVFLIAVSFVTYAYNLAVDSSGGTAYGHEAVSRIIYSVMYVAILYICANHSFALIDHVPENALRWMGQSGQAIPKLGDAGHVAQVETLVASYAGQQAIQAVGSSGSALASGVGNTADKIGQRFESAKRDEKQKREEDERQKTFADTINSARLQQGSESNNPKPPSLPAPSKPPSPPDDPEQVGGS